VQTYFFLLRENWFFDFFFPLACKMCPTLLLFLTNLRIGTIITSALETILLQQHIGFLPLEITILLSLQSLSSRHFQESGNSKNT